MLGSCRGGQINALDRVKKEAAQFTDHTTDSDRETLAHRWTKHGYGHFLKRTVGNGLGKLYGTGCEGLTV